MDPYRQYIISLLDRFSQQHRIRHSVDFFAVDFASRYFLRFSSKRENRPVADQFINQKKQQQNSDNFQYGIQPDTPSGPPGMKQPIQQPVQKTIPPSRNRRFHRIIKSSILQKRTQEILFRLTQTVNRRILRLYYRLVAPCTSRRLTAKQEEKYPYYIPTPSRQSD